MTHMRAATSLVFAAWLGALTAGSGIALAQEPPKLELPSARFLTVNYTFQVAEVPQLEVRQIVTQVEKSSFDRPKSWENELRVRRVALGASEVLIIRGSDLLCGATGNCQTWVFLHRRGQWIDLFPSQAPMASGLGFEERGSLGLKDAVTVTALGPDMDRYTVWRFDGRVYRAVECLSVEASPDREEPRIAKASCQ